MKILNKILFVFVLILFAIYLSINFFVGKYNKSKSIAVGMKINENSQSYKYAEKMKELIELSANLLKTRNTDRTKILTNARNLMEQISINSLDFAMKNKFLSIKSQIKKEEQINNLYIAINRALIKNRFNKSYKLAHSFFILTQDKDIFNKIKSKKSHRYTKIANKEFTKQNYQGAKSYLKLLYTLSPSESILEKITTIDNISQLSQYAKNNAFNMKRNSVNMLDKLKRKIEKYEKQYKFLHAYYTLKQMKNDSFDIVQLQRSLNTIAKKWQETKKIAKNLLKDGFVLLKTEKRQNLEQALKKVEIAQKYFPYFYEYDRLKKDIIEKLKYSGMKLLQCGTVKYYDPKTKKIITQNVEDFYIDTEFVKFGEYLEYLATVVDKDKFEKLRRTITSHKFRGDINNKELELVNYNDIVKFATYLGKRLPTLAELSCLCGYEESQEKHSENRKRFSLYSNHTVNNNVMVFGINYLMEKRENCSTIFKLPKTHGVLGVSARFVKGKK